ncbi:MAG: deoxyguanosinetriphosphate triphosphohydrolase [Synergistaceae bacterium]|nr:deoxyguanosinetriphosphate triphosphohydrolase [Synergistaceae bacterium]
MNPRQHQEEIERQTLSHFACLSVNSKGRKKAEPECTVRTCFQRDRDRIIHSKSFRRLKYKTQVLLLPEGDHYRTRLTHTLEVTQIARTIARAMRLNEDLAEAIALGHDLGHTPFGHVGETVLNKLAKEHGLGGFHHAAQSLRVVDTIEKDGEGLNLTWEVRMGIIQHSKGQVDVHLGYNLEKPTTMEAWAVRISDSIAYVNHDLDDALRAGFFAKKDLPSEITRGIGETHSRRINALISNLLENSSENELKFGDDMLEHIEFLRRYLYDNVYRCPNAVREDSRVDYVLTAIFNYEIQNGRTPRETIDFVSGMTDRFALNYFDKLFVPTPWSE